MIKINKGYNLKVISLLVTITFLLNNAVYGIDLLNKGCLRVPVGERKNYARMQEAIDEHYIKLVLDLAYKRLIEGKIPIVAIAVNNKSGEIIISEKPLWKDEKLKIFLNEHAEMNALTKAVDKGWDMSDTVIYVSLESCINCAMGIANVFRPQRVVTATIDSFPFHRGIGFDIISNANILNKVVSSKIIQNQAQSLISLYYSSRNKKYDADFSFDPLDWNVKNFAQNSEVLLNAINKILSDDIFTRGDPGRLTMLVYYVIKIKNLLPGEKYPQIIAIDSNHMHQNVQLDEDYMNSTREVAKMLRRINKKDDRFKIILLGEDKNIKKRYLELMYSGLVESQRVYILKNGNLISYKEFDPLVTCEDAFSRNLKMSL